MEDVRRLLQENAACKVKIEGLEADLERLMRDRPPATESSEMLLDAGSYLDVPHLVPSIDGSMNFDDESEDDATGR
jgi:hypothetical protein